MRTTRLIGPFLLCILCCINLTFCDPANSGGDDLIWDFAPMVLYISVQDVQGNDLLNPLTRGSIANQEIKAIYKRETYEKDAPLNERARAYTAYLTGLQAGISKDGKYYLTFGEFDDNHTSDNEKVEIDWNDGKGPSVITSSSRLTWESKKGPVFDRKFCLNEQKIDQKQGLVTTRPPSQSEQKFDIATVEYGISVGTGEAKEKIKVDLESKSPYTNGESYSASIQEENSDTYTSLGSGGFPITKKGFTIREAEAHGTYGMTTGMTKTCRLIPPNGQIYNHIKSKLGTNAERSSSAFNIFIGRPYNSWVYEDLAEHYKDKYPDDKVKEIVRLLESKPNSPTKQRIIMEEYGLAGCPLQHSFPIGYFSGRFKPEDVNTRYVNFEIPSINNLTEVTEENPSLCGLNMTIPYKEQTIPFLDEPDRGTVKIGAVNVIKIIHQQKGKVKLVGYNSGIIGFIQFIQPLLQPRHRKILILGAGGASRAVYHRLEGLGIEDIFVPRTHKTDDMLTYEELTLEIMVGYIIIVNCTPVGTFPKIDFCPNISYELLILNRLLYDLLCSPNVMLFMKKGGA